MSIGLLQVDAPLRKFGAQASYDLGRQGVLLLLLVLWFVPGLTNRAPWKPVETSVVPAVVESQAANTLLVPQLLGQPYLELPPLPAGVAAGSATLFSPPLAAHEAMRLGNIFWLGLSLGLAGVLVGWFHGSRVGWRTVLLITGSPGLLLHARTVNPDLALLALGVCGMLGVWLNQTRPLAGHVLLSITAAVGLWACGTLALWYVLLLVVIPVILQPTNFSWHKHAGVLAVSMAGFASLGLWLVVLDNHNPALSQLVGEQQLAALAPVTLAVTLQQLIKSAAWVLWPALPFAALAVVSLRTKRDYPPHMRAGLLALGAGTLAILATGAANDTTVFLLLPIVATMAAISVSSLTKEIAKAMDWFAIIVIGGGLIGFFWFSWLLVQLDFAPGLVSWLAKQGITPPPPTWTALAAVLATLLWVGLMLRIGRSPERSVLNWMAGTTMGWWVFTLLWLPAVDTAKGYAAVGKELATAIAPLPCVHAQAVPQSVLAQLEYYTERNLRVADCAYVLVAQPRSVAGEILWQGSRSSAEPNEQLRLVKSKKL